jgi:hypothetical protein
MFMVLVVGATLAAAPPAVLEGTKYGPAAALAIGRGYRVESYMPDVRYCYPDARGMPIADCKNIIPMSP